MSFSQFTLKSVKTKLGLEIVENQRLFSEIKPEPISDLLRAVLARTVPLALAINTEKSRSEGIIAPILTELREQSNHRISLFSGTNWSVNSELGLEGYSDFLLSLSPEQYYLTAPVVVVVEAKKEDIIAGLGQCVATMHAAVLFNLQEGNEIPCIYGVVTSGAVWKFIKLEGGIVFIDPEEYGREPIENLMGILVHLIRPQGKVSELTLTGKK